MADQQIEFTTDEIETLAQKLDAFGSELNEKERATLLAIMSLATSAIAARVAESEVETFGAGSPLAPVTLQPPTAFGNGLRSAFTSFAPGRPSVLRGTALRSRATSCRSWISQHPSRPRPAPAPTDAASRASIWPAGTLAAARRPLWVAADPRGAKPS